MNKKYLLIGLLAALLLLGLLFWWHQAHQRDDDTLYGNVDIRTVNSSFRVAGRLLSINKEEGDLVKQGELLAKIDPEPYQIALQQAQAAEAQAQAKLDLLQAGFRQEEIAQAKSAVAQSQAAYDYAERNYQRLAKLLNQASISRDQLDQARQNRDQTKASLQAAQQKLQQLSNGYRPQEIAQAKAALETAQADVAQAELNLKDTELYAPADGMILTRVIEPGTLVNQGAPIYAISLQSPVWIRAYIDEVNLAKAKPGRKVLIYTDSRPNRPYSGQIGYVSPTAEFTPKNVETPVLRTDLVYRLRIQVAQAGEGKADAELRQGMPVTIKLAD